MKVKKGLHGWRWSKGSNVEVLLFQNHILFIYSYFLEVNEALCRADGASQPASPGRPEDWGRSVFAQTIVLLNNYLIVISLHLWINC